MNFDLSISTKLENSHYVGQILKNCSSENFNVAQFNIRRLVL